MNPNIREYLAKIGSKGGKKSRRHLSTAAAKKMVKIREARRAYRQYYSQCFWSFDIDYKITEIDLPWVAEQLKTYGGRCGWELGIKLCP